jgi:hypothetical protein
MPEDSILHSHRRENLRSYMRNFVGTNFYDYFLKSRAVQHTSHAGDPEFGPKIEPKPSKLCSPFICLKSFLTILNCLHGDNTELNALAVPGREVKGACSSVLSEVVFQNKSMILKIKLRRYVLTLVEVIRSETFGSC